MAVKVKAYPRGTKFYVDGKEVSRQEGLKAVRAGETMSIETPTKEPVYVSTATAKGNLRKVAGEDAMFELSDILEDVSPGDVKAKVVENLTYLLKREKMLSEEMSIVIPEGSYNWQIEDASMGEGVFRKYGSGTQTSFVLEGDRTWAPTSSGVFTGDFEVFGPPDPYTHRGKPAGPNIIVAEGHVDAGLQGGMLIDIEALITRAR